MIIDIIKEATDKPSKYKGTAVEAWSNAHPVTSGVTIGEAVAELLMSDAGYEVLPRSSTQHDRIVDGKKTEIKTAFQAEDNDNYLFYGYKPTDDPHQWVFQFVQPDETITLVVMDRVSMSHVYLRESKGAFMFSTTLQEMIDAGGEVIATESVVEAKSVKVDDATVFPVKDDCGICVAWNWVRNGLFGGGFNTKREAMQDAKGEK